MSLERTPPVQIPGASSMAPVTVEPSACQICHVTMTEGQDCLIISECSHPFHRSCIENHLATSADCPVCKRPCQLDELRSLVIVQKVLPAMKPLGNRGKSRGAIAKQYHTRSNRNIFVDLPSSQLDVSSNDQAYGLATPDRNANRADGHSAAMAVPAPVVSIDYGEINRMIELNLTRLLQRMPVFSAPQPQHPNQFQTNGQGTNATQDLRSNVNPVRNHTSSSERHNASNVDMTRQPSTHRSADANFFDLSPNRLTSSSTSQMASDKVTSIIQSWNLKFDGSPSGLNVDEFLYRVRSLTNDNFNGDFSAICRNLNILLTGKAKEWYWRYHKQVTSLNWNDFREAIRCQYKDSKTSYDIREEIRNRRQKPNETFDSFFEAIAAIMDRLSTPMTEEELIDILPRNLRPEVRQDLLYVRINSISHLRQLVRTRENFLNDEYVKRNLATRVPMIGNAPRRYVAEVGDPEVFDGSEDDVLNIDAVRKPNVKSQCWNCDDFGHHWQDCLCERTIFCYGCGAKNMYKPNCPDCKARRPVHSKNSKSMGPHVD